MKKIVYLLTIFSLVFASCDPLEDVYDELDAQGTENVVIGDAIITLTEDDYKNEAKDGGLELANSYFESNDQAKEMLPEFIRELYPVWGAGSTVVVNYNINSPIPKTAYTVTDADYAAIGLESLVSKGDFNRFFDYKFPSTDKGSIVDLTYKTPVKTIEYTLTEDDYDLVGNGRFDNFDIRPGRAEETIEARRAKIETILLNNFPDATVGQQYNVTYAIWDGAPGTRNMLVQLNSSDGYNLINSYTLTDADFDLVGNGRFNNFDIRPGRAEETIEARRAKIETILLNNFPSAVTGDKYFVTYAVWEGFAGTRTMLLEFNGTGYDIDQTLVSETSRFVFVNDWDSPYVLVEEDYQAMGQDRNKFDGRTEDEKAEAIRLISIYLGQKNPFAAAEDFIAVQYISDNGPDDVTVNVNFIFDGDKWNGIPDVIATSLQFGFEDGMWVPDNTIKYTLTNADYALVGNGRFNNFDVRPDRDEETVEARLAKINTILLNNFPQYGEGQKFSVSYNVWKPGDDVFVMNVIHNGTEYILQ